MEKFRKWGDASTGINPFVFPFQASLSIVSVILFPFRVLVAAATCVLLFIADVVSHSLRVLGLAFIARCTTVIIAKGLSRILLFVLGNLNPSMRIFPPVANKTTTTTNSVNNNGDSLTKPAPGDVVFCNLLSPLDVLVISSAWSGLEFCTVVFVDVKQAVAARCADSKQEEEAMLCVEFTPSPFQRWKVARHVFHVSTKAYLSSCTTGSINTAAGRRVLDLSIVQRKSEKLGVPVLVFPEGITSNGKGILSFASSFRFSTIRNGQKSSTRARPQLFLAALNYHSHSAVARVLDWNSAFSYIVRLSSDAPSDRTIRTLYVTVARPSCGAPPLISEDEDEDVREKTADQAWLDEVRLRMSHLVQYRNPSVVCKVLHVGLAEKVGFSEQWATTMP